MRGSRYNGSLWIGGNFSRVQVPHIFPFPNDTPSFLYWPGKMSFSFMNIYLHSFLRLIRIFLPHPYYFELYYFIAYTASPWFDFRSPQVPVWRAGTERGNLIVASIGLIFYSYPGYTENPFNSTTLKYSWFRVPQSTGWLLLKYSTSYTLSTA